MNIESIELTPHQKGELGKVLEALGTGQSPVVLAGAAGTGKTTCMNLLASDHDHFPKPLFMAPTNRAALVLRQKLSPGTSVATIHSATMQLRRSTHDKEIETLRGLLRQSEIPELDNIDMPEWLQKELESIQGLGFDTWRKQLVRLLRQAERDNELVFNVKDDPEHDSLSHVVVDEASMVTTTMLDAIDRNFPNVPLIFVGDVHQLPPILNEIDRAEGVQPVLTALKPTGQLDEVIRQAKTSRVLEFVTWLRKQTKPLKLSRFADKLITDELTIIRRPASGVTKGLLRQFAQRVEVGGIVLCRRNDTRRAINRELRPLLGWQDETSILIPVPGERLVVSAAPSQNALESGQALDPVTGNAVDWGSPLFDAKKGSFIEVVTARRETDRRGYSFIQVIGLVDGVGQQAGLSVAASDFLRTHQLDEGHEWGFTPRGWFQLDYGACMSVHKAQGSEFDAVAVYEQMAPWQPNEKTGKWQRPCSVEHRQWCYTAATRAKKSLLWVAAPAGGGRKGG